MSIDKTRIVPQAAVARAFVAMFLGEPHGTTRSAKALREKIGKDLFASGHKHYPYYVSAVALYKLESRFRAKTLDAKFKVARFHIMLALRLIEFGKNLPKINSDAMEQYCIKVADLLWGPNADTALDKAINAVQTAAEGNYERDFVRTQTFTEKVTSVCAGVLPY